MRISAPVEYELLRRDGTTFYGETMGTSLRNAMARFRATRTTRYTTERRRTEAALRESEERYRKLYNGAMEGIYRTSLEGKALGSQRGRGGDARIRVRRQASSTECVDSGHQVWADPDERSSSSSSFSNRGSVRDLRMPVRRKDGTQIWVSLSTAGSSSGSRGKPGYDEGFILDITKRRVAEDLLRRSEQNYRLMFDSAPLAINVTRGIEITYANPSYLEMFGYSTSKSCERSHRSSSSCQNGVPRLLRSPNVVEKASRHLTPTKQSASEETARDSRFSSSSRGRRSRDGPASVGFYHSTSPNPSGQKKSYATADLQFRTFVEQAPVAIAVTRDGTVVYSNQKVADMCGVESPDGLLGQPAYVLFAPHLREESKERTRRRSRGLPVPAEYDSIGVRVDGSQFPMHLAVGTVQLRDGNARIAFIS